MPQNRFHHSYCSKKNILYIVTLLSIGALLFLSITIAINPVQQRKEAPYPYQEIIEKVSAENIFHTISHLQSQKNRSIWEEQWKAAYWLSSKFKNSGIEVGFHQYEFRGRIWPNVVAMIKGEEKPGEIVLFCAHLDSTSDNAEKPAPGADDNAGGVAALLEAARVLKQIPMKRTVVFCIFSNEERAAAGSKAYARLVKKEGYNIKQVINVDVVGYNRPAWPFYWDALSGDALLRHKLKAAAKMVYNYGMGIIYGKDIVVVAGKEPNRQLTLATSRVLQESAGLKVRGAVQNDCG